jgi:hypothetical protein
MIKERTRKGKGLGEGSKPTMTNLPALEPETVRRRRRKTLSPHTSPRKSNMTETGKLVSAISARAVKYGIRLFLRENRKDKRSNNVIANAHEAGDVPGGKKRRFFGLSVRERSKIVKRLESLFDIKL